MSVATFCQARHGFIFGGLRQRVAVGMVVFSRVLRGVMLKVARVNGTLPRAPSTKKLLQPGL